MVSDDRHLRFVARIAFAAAVIAIIVGSLIPGKAMPDVFSWSDKLLHFCGYFSLGFLSGVGMPRHSRALVLFVPLFGLGLEIAQIAVPGRGFDWFDVGANTAGAMAGLALSRLRLGERARGSV